MPLFKRALALLTGWVLILWGLGMDGAGHASWQMFGASTIYVGTLEAAALDIAGDAIFAGLLIAKGGETSKIVIGFFAVAGILLSVAAFGALRSSWHAGM